MDKLLNLTDMEKDALRECANVGIGNAATALSKLLKKKIEIQIPETKFILLSDFSKEIGGPETIVSGLYLEIQGDLIGDVLFIFSENEAKRLIDMLFGKTVNQTESVNELDESGFKEMSNIVTGSYLNALANLLDLKILPSVPYTATDMAQAMVDHVLVKMAKHSDKILLIKTRISVEGHNISGIFIIIFTYDSLKKIIKRLHDKYEI